MALLIFCIIGACILSAIIFFSIKEYIRKKRILNKGLYFYTIFGLAFFVLLLFGKFEKVGANEVGIIYDDRYGVLEETMKEGFNTKSIFEHVTTISTANRDAKVSTTGQTNDGQFATFDLSLIYNINNEDAGKFFKKTNSTTLSDDQLNSLVKKALQSSTIKYDIFELLSEGLETCRVDFEEDLRTQLMENYHVTLISASFDDVDAGKEIEAILQSKAEADQKIEIAKKEAQANLITAENEVEVAKQKAEQEKALAEAESYAIELKGKADAEAANAYTQKIMSMIDAMVESSEMSYEKCSEIILSIVFYDTWDGSLPQVLTSDSLSSLIGSLITSNN